MRGPAGTRGGGTYQLGGARLAQVAQAKFDRVHARRRGQLVDVGLVCKRIWQGRHAAQPGSAQHGRHVVDSDAQVVVVIRWARGAVAHLKCLCHWFNRAGQQQGQCGRAVGGVSGLKIIGCDRTVSIQASVDLHQLRCALGFPGVLLLARELHAHRLTDRTRQQRRIRSHVVGTVAPVAARRLHADHVDLGVRQAHQTRQVGAQHMRVLAARPDRQAMFCRRATARAKRGAFGGRRARRIGCA